MKSNTSIYTDVTTDECKCRLQAIRINKQSASKVITQVRSSWKRLACLGVDEYAGKKYNHLAEEIIEKRSLTKGSIGGQGKNSYFHCANT